MIFSFKYGGQSRPLMFWKAIDTAHFLTQAKNFNTNTEYYTLCEIQLSSTNSNQNVEDEPQKRQLSSVKLCGVEVPPDVLLLVLSNLRPIDVLRVGQCNKALLYITNDNGLWKHLVAQHTKLGVAQNCNFKGFFFHFMSLQIDNF